MISANIGENREATMANFLGGLNHDSQDVVELQHFLELENLVYLAMTVKKQLRRKDSTR